MNENKVADAIDYGCELGVLPKKNGFQSVRLNLRPSHQNPQEDTARVQIYAFLA